MVAISHPFANADARQMSAAMVIDLSVNVMRWVICFLASSVFLADLPLGTLNHTSFAIAGAIQRNLFARAKA